MEFNYFVYSVCTILYILFQKIKVQFRMPKQMQVKAKIKVTCKFKGTLTNTMSLFTILNEKTARKHFFQDIVHFRNDGQSLKKPRKLCCFSKHRLTNDQLHISHETGRLISLARLPLPIANSK